MAHLTQAEISEILTFDRTDPEAAFGAFRRLYDAGLWRRYGEMVGSSLVIGSTTSEFRRRRAEYIAEHPRAQQ